MGISWRSMFLCFIFFLHYCSILRLGGRRGVHGLPVGCNVNVVGLAYCANLQNGMGMECSPAGAETVLYRIGVHWIIHYNHHNNVSICLFKMPLVLLLLFLQFLVGSLIWIEKIESQRDWVVQKEARVEWIWWMYRRVSVTSW